MFEEEKKRIAYLTLEKLSYNSILKRVKEIDEEILQINRSIIYSCEHPNAVTTSTYTDCYEQRTYADIFCPDCGDKWEERVRCGKLLYPRKEEKGRD